MPTRPRPNRGTRPYHRSGEHIVAKAVPFLVERVKDPRVADEALTPVERGARAWRGEVLHDLGKTTPGQDSSSVPTSRQSSST